VLQLSWRVAKYVKGMNCYSLIPSPVRVGADRPINLPLAQLGLIFLGVVTGVALALILIVLCRRRSFHSCNFLLCHPLRSSHFEMCRKTSHQGNKRNCTSHEADSGNCSFKSLSLAFPEVVYLAKERQSRGRLFGFVVFLVFGEGGHCKALYSNKC
jgi:hypothetical protein